MRFKAKGNVTHTFLVVAKIDDSKVLDTVGDTVQNLVLSHAVWVAVATEADDYQTLLFRQDSLVDVPAAAKVGEDDGAHDGSLSLVFSSCGVVGVVVKKNTQDEPRDFKNSGCASRSQPGPTRWWGKVGLHFQLT